VGIAGLLNGAVARRHGLVILHYDHDFVMAADVLDFDHRWVAEPGAL